MTEESVVDNANVCKGAVKWFDNARGFGFIEHEDGRDVFVHYSVIESEGFRTLKDGELVTYEMKEGDKGLHAIKVTRNRTPRSMNMSNNIPKPEEATKETEIIVKE